MTLPIPYGTSEPQDVQLKNGGVAYDGTGLQVELVIARTTSAGVGSPAPVADWLDASTGTVRITGVEVLEVGNYKVRYRITDGASTIGYFPNGESYDTWEVVTVP